MMRLSLTINDGEVFARHEITGRGIPDEAGIVTSRLPDKIMEILHDMRAAQRYETETRKQ